FDICAFVVALFALACCDFEFDVPTACHEFERYYGSSLLFGGDKHIDFFALGEQAPATCLLRLINLERIGATNCGVDKPELVVSDSDCGTSKLTMTHTESFGFSPCELNADNILVF